ncbi:uncharacterized protein LOC127749814 [Frankliniella occidentalis]|uniref:Uncharacterized protein LOC127749814 n=1 Tax=Frankliniella occidentalis TaxID=133901 RepID=A0A9C6WZ91_FRAOC|nr:uncharacterized protein LOC127749814 [Frankliniella occidentalis]
MSTTLWFRVSTNAPVVWIGPSHHLWVDPDHVPLAIYNPDIAGWEFGETAAWDEVARPPAPLRIRPRPLPAAGKGASGAPAPHLSKVVQQAPSSSPFSSSDSTGPSEVWSTPSPGRYRQPQNDSGVGLASPLLLSPTQPGWPASPAGAVTASARSSSPSSDLSSPCGPPCLAPWNCACCSSPGTLCQACREAASAEWEAEVAERAQRELDKANDAAVAEAHWLAKEETWATEDAQAACQEFLGRESDLAADLAVAADLGR